MSIEETVEIVPPVKKSFMGKIVKWTITIAVLLVVANFISGLRTDQKDKFTSTARTHAEQRCKGDAACLATLKEKFSQCLEAHSESHKTGKYGRKYTLDEPAFYDCLR